jgi:hypothetical protein
MNHATQTTEAPWRQFEDLVHRILLASGFSVEIHSPRGDEGFDLVGTQNSERWAIEVKFYRTSTAQPRLIESAATRLVRNGAKEKMARGMLIVSCVLPDPLRSELEKRFTVVFVDREELRLWAISSPALVDELNSLLEEDPENIQRQHVIGANEVGVRSRPLDASALPAQDKKGSALCQGLRQIALGKEGWSSYEKQCEAILRYLFDHDLHGWHSQNETDDRLNRFDFVCRVRSQNGFWKFLVDHLNSRYIVFEFKNYSGMIGQGPILTTEKYLLERGLRRVAVIFTRKGVSTAGKKMIQGAMREHGKLILVLDDEMVCAMLRMKELGEDPGDFLFERTDEFLLTLPR